MARTLKREEVAFPSAPDPRFGGNLARANVGKQYSRAFPGGPPGVDRMYENYQAPHRVDYTSPPYGGPGEPSQGYWQQMRAPVRPSFEEWRPNINPRGMNQKLMREMMGGLGGLQEQAAVDPSDWRTIIKILEAGGDPGTETQVAYSPGASYDDDDYGPFIPPSVIEMDLEGIDYGPSDEYDYDRKRGYPGYIYDSPPSYAARGGLMSLRR